MVEKRILPLPWVFKKPARLNPRRGRFWKGVEIKALKRKLSRKTDYLLQKLPNDIVDYTNRFEKPIIALEELTHIRNLFQKNQKGKRLNQRMASLPFRKLQNCIEYIVLKRGIGVKYIDPKHTKKQFHRCGTIINMGFYRNLRCPHCGLIYDRDLNGSINIAQGITN
ncbi:MAG: IS200/IS605 family element transposase accessory protein TnpB [Candidatus Lokiarchaeota archaeon]|nr:IS200/IS605 family element transposase accessory protein TnpB [Candidatus Lokiarchaeota archaeon]